MVRRGLRLAVTNELSRQAYGVALVRKRPGCSPSRTLNREDRKDAGDAVTHVLPSAGLVRESRPGGSCGPSAKARPWTSIVAEGRLICDDPHR